MSGEGLVIKCISGQFKDYFLYANKSDAGEIFGSGTREDYPSITMRIEEAGLDPIHSKVLFKGEKYYLIDLSSSSGTWLQLGQESISPGMTIKIDNVEFSIRRGPTMSLSEHLSLPLPAGVDKHSEGLPQTLDSLIFSSSTSEFTVGYKPVVLKQEDYSFQSYESVSIYFQDSRFCVDRPVFKRVQEEEIPPGSIFRIGHLDFEACRFNVGLVSEIGSRPANEDTEVAIQDLHLASHPISYFAIFDGHGGDQCSTYLQAHLHEYLKAHYNAGFTDEAICQAFEECDAAFYRDLPETAKREGSAATVAIIDKDELICANVGDSRVMVCQKGQCVQLTKDHKPSDPDEAERIQKNGGMIIFGRVFGSLAISRAFGDFEFKDIYASDLHEEVSGPLVIPKPDVFRYRISANLDEFVLLSCDGLFEVFSSDEAVSFIREKLRNMPPTEQNPKAVAAEIVNEAIVNRRSGDNVSVIIVSLTPDIE